jgi:hypothetical protein
MGNIFDAPVYAFANAPAPVPANAPDRASRRVLVDMHAPDTAIRYGRSKPNKKTNYVWRDNNLFADIDGLLVLVHR